MSSEWKYLSSIEESSNGEEFEILEFPEFQSLNTCDIPSNHPIPEHFEGSESGEEADAPKQNFTEMNTKQLESYTKVDTKQPSKEIEEKITSTYEVQTERINHSIFREYQDLPYNRLYLRSY